MQHILWKLKPKGLAGVVLANGSLSSMVSNEGIIRKELVINQKIEAIISLPSKLFLNTGIPVSLWILSHNNQKKKNEILFINANELGELISRKQRVLFEHDIKKISNTFLSWRLNKNYKDLVGFCRSVTIDEVKKGGYYLTPSRYTGHEDELDDQVTLEEKLQNYIKKINELKLNQKDTSDQIDKILKKLIDNEK